MTPLGELVNAWETVSKVPIFVGSAPEKTVLPYCTLNSVQSNPIVLAPRVLGWTEGLVQFNSAAIKLQEAEALAELARSTFRFFRGRQIADMVLLNEGNAYSRQPNLSGNRGWVATLEFRIRY